MKIVTKTIPELTPEEYRACYNANFRLDGEMQLTLMLARQTSRHEAIAIMLVDETATGMSRLVGWALLTPTKTTGMLAVSQYIKRRSKYTVQFWVKRQHRRKGYGKMLMDEVKKIDPRPHVLPHDETSKQFLSNYHVSVLKKDKEWFDARKRKMA